MNQEILEEAIDKSENWYNKLSFEVMWEFAGLTQLEMDSLETLVKNAYLHGYLSGKDRK